MKKSILFVLTVMLLQSVWAQNIKLPDNKTEIEQYSKLRVPQDVFEQYSDLLVNNQQKLNKLFRKNFRPQKPLKDQIVANVILFVNDKSETDSVIIYYTGVPKVIIDDKKVVSSPIEIIEKVSPSVNKKVVKSVRKILAEYSPQLGIGQAHIIRFSGSLNPPVQTEQKNPMAYLNELPDTVKKISLRDYGLTKIPESVYRFKNLEELDLSNNALQKIRISMHKLGNLKVVSVQNNRLRKVAIRGKGSLKAVNLINNRLEKLPRKFGHAESLLLANNFINELKPGDYKRLSDVVELNLYDNFLSHIGPQIALLSKLEELDLYRNSLLSLPAEINQLKKLKTLAVSHNHLTQLPEGLYQLENLKTLYVHHNQISALNGNLPASLELLDIGFNALKEMPDYLGGLKNLKSLDFSNNQVRGSIDFLLKLDKLEEVFLFNNRYASTTEEEEAFIDVLKILEKKDIAVR